jgi:hypothetical protein
MLIAKSVIETGKTKGKGWIVEAKPTYIEKHDDVLIGAAIYK